MPEERSGPASPLSQSSLANSGGTSLPHTLQAQAPSLPSQTQRQAAPSPTTPAPPIQKKRPGWLYIALAAILLVVLVGSAFGVYLIYTQGTSSTQSTIVGHAFFVSSGLLSSTNSSQGITDELQINLQNLPAPQPGKRYYAWLRNDQQIDLPAVAIGAVPLNHQHLTMTYKDPQHNNLLATFDRFLITTEDANQSPTNPSITTNTWH